MNDTMRHTALTDALNFYHRDFNEIFILAQNELYNSENEKEENEL